MKILAKARNFVRDDSGAVTVDWVVLTAAVVLLSIGAITILDGSIASMVNDIDTALSSAGDEVAADASFANANDGGGDVGTAQTGVTLNTPD
jgi:Flp pilus assembly pilin Flp